MSCYLTLISSQKYAIIRLIGWLVLGGGKQKHIIWGSHAHSGEPTSHDQETQHELEQGSAPFFGKRLDSKYFRL